MTYLIIVGLSETKMNNRGGTKSKQVRNAEIKIISDLLDKWKSDKEIMDQLKIPKATYYRYKASICEEDKELLKQIRANELEHRIIQVRNALEYCISVNRKICENSKDDDCKIDASAMIIKAQMGLLNLMRSGPYHEQVRIIKKEVDKNTEKLESV